jgi:hypothetical protein
MKLRFYTGKGLARFPGSASAGQYPHYIGRVREPVMVDGHATWPATTEPSEYNVVPTTPQGAMLSARFADLARVKSIFPADQETATALGVEFVAVEVVDGAVVERAAARVKRASFVARKTEPLTPSAEE